MRATANAALPGRGTVKRPTRADDGYGGTTVTVSTIATNVPYRLRPIATLSEGSYLERLENGRLTANPGFVLTVPAGTDLTEPDQFVAGAKTYEVVVVMDSPSTEIERRAIVVEIR